MLQNGGEALLLRPHFHQQTSVEGNRQLCTVSVHRPHASPCDVVHDTVVAVFEAAQFDGALPLLGKEAVVHGLVLTDDMRFRHIEADVIELPKILPSRQHLVAIDAKPLFEFLLPLRSQIGFAPLLHQGRKNKLRTHDAAHRPP